MKKRIIVCCLLSAPIAFVWWRLWMYHGFIGSFGLIQRLGRFDGETSYDAALVEMYLLSAIGLVFLASFIPRKK